jgi:hypothetical protein
LLAGFRKHYPPSLLRALRCEFAGADQEKSNWLLNLVRRPKNSHHPLRHLLLIDFFGISAEDFFALPEEVRFFGNAPWPCLNPAADHSMEERVADCQVSFRGPNHRPVGTFRCDCGFDYSRTGPDGQPEDRFRISKMKSFGSVWERELKRLWADPANGISAVARRLEVDPLTVRRHAARLGLLFKRAGGKEIAPPNLRALLKSEDALEKMNVKRGENRRLWLSAFRRKPKSSLKSLRSELPRVYSWLSKNDAAWLNSHKPQPLKRRRFNSSVDWNRRDAKLAVAIRSKASELLNAPGKPAIVSRSAIGRSIGQSTMLRLKIHKLPLASAALETVMNFELTHQPDA